MTGQYEQNPGPGKYNELKEKPHGYSLRPRTANNRNCRQFKYLDFINDQERMLVPGPGNYDN